MGAREFVAITAELNFSVLAAFEHGAGFSHLVAADDPFFSSAA
jgi:hypothetical protein